MLYERSSCRASNQIGFLSLTPPFNDGGNSSCDDGVCTLDGGSGGCNDDGSNVGVNISPQCCFLTSSRSHFATVLRLFEVDVIECRLPCLERRVGFQSDFLVI